MMSVLAQNIEPLVATGQQLLADVITAGLVVEQHESDLHAQLRNLSEIIVAVIDVMTVVVILYGFTYAIFLFVKMHMNNLFGEKHTAIDLSVIRVKL